MGVKAEEEEEDEGESIEEKKQFFLAGGGDPTPESGEENWKEERSDGSGDGHLISLKIEEMEVDKMMGKFL